MEDVQMVPNRAKYIRILLSTNVFEEYQVQFYFRLRELELKEVMYRVCSLKSAGSKLWCVVSRWQEFLFAVFTAFAIFTITHLQRYDSIGNNFTVMINNSNLKPEIQSENTET